MLKQYLKKIIPNFLFSLYHLSWAVLANIVYRFPSRRLVVIGVTGTKGKTTTCNMIWQVLTEAGYKVGMTTTANIRIGSKEWINDSKMTMQGRLRLQKLLRQMVKAGCRYAVIETSSEGILQWRHFGIKYQGAVFTNLSPEHLERHGSFANYRAAKGRLFKQLSGLAISVINNDDDNADYFKSFPAKTKVYYGINRTADFQAVNLRESEKGSTFEVKGRIFHLPLWGRFNVYNALAAISVGRALGVDWQILREALNKFDYVPGRMERIQAEQGFLVIVDYAHTPESLKLVYQTLRPRARRLIAVLGAAGGGRDKNKRHQLGAIAAQYADVAIVTNEDPYDDDPIDIINQVWSGLSKDSLEKYKIVDREEAIKKAISLAQMGDIVVITGKGSEQAIVTKTGKISWDDREIVKKYINRVKSENRT